MPPWGGWEGGSECVGRARAGVHSPVGGQPGTSAASTFFALVGV